MKCDLGCSGCKQDCSLKYYQPYTLSSGKAKNMLPDIGKMTLRRNNSRIRIDARRLLKQGFSMNVGGGIPPAMPISHDELREFIPDPLNTVMAKAYYDYGYQFEEQGQYKKAIEKYKQAIKKDPNFIPTYPSLGRLFVKLGRLEEAKKAYTRAIEKNPKDATSLSSMGRILRLEHKLEDAILLFEKSRDIKPCFPPVLNLAGIHRELGNGKCVSRYVSEARKYIRPEEWYNLACLESICGNVEVAITALSKAARQQEFNGKSAWSDPDLAWIRDHPSFEKIAGQQPN
jgi:tetratricopeptide (TPR) repeat protein